MNSLDFSLSSSGGEENDDEDVSFSEPPLDDEDDEPLTRPSSGFSPSPQPLTSTQKPQAQGVDEKQNDKNEIGKKQSISKRASWNAGQVDRFVVFLDKTITLTVPVSTQECIYILLDILACRIKLWNVILLEFISIFGTKSKTVTRIYPKRNKIAANTFPEKDFSL